jgi:predicted transcriptional regulator
MRTIIDLPDSQIEALRILEERNNVSRALLVRQAIAEYVAKHTETHDAFGAWKSRKTKIDGLTHQNQLRDEWER